MSGSIATWALIGAVVVAALIYASTRSRQSVTPKAPARDPVGDLVARALALPGNSDFVADVARVYRNKGRLSAKQIEALQRIVDRVETSRQERPFIAPVGQDIVVEGDVIKVDYEGKGKARRGRYVIDTEKGTVVYEGPAILVGRFGAVRFLGTVISHEDSSGGYCDTVVGNPRDIAILKRPSEGLRDLKGSSDQSA